MNFFSFKKVAFTALVVSGFTLSGCLTDDKDDTKDSIPVVVVDSVKTKTVVLGAQDNAKAGSVDLDTWTAYTANEGVTSYASIDIVFAFSTKTSEASIYSPNIAKNGVSGGSGGFDFMANWPNANTTSLKIPAAAFDFAKVTTGAAVKAGYDAGTDPTVAGKVPVAVGTVILVKTDKGLHVALKVTAVTASATGTLDLTGIAKW